MNKGIFFLALLLVGSLAFSGYLAIRLFDTKDALSRSSSALEDMKQKLAIATDHISSLESTLVDAENDRSDLEDAFREEKEKNDAFEDQIADIGSTVNTLDKLAKTDPQLLAKYSKVYFLNEHYTPEKLIEIDKDHLYEPNTPKFIHAKVKPFLEDMITAAKKDGITLLVASAYRSFDEQTSLKGAYKVTYGSGANTFSADQGYSEHQLGTTVDLTTPTLNGSLEGFDKTPAYEWMKRYAYRYGFILSYPPNNSYYEFEPWHWRFVGKDLARYLRSKNEYFYDADQRTIDSYLVSLFDK